MFLRKIIDIRFQKIIKEIFNKSIVIIFFILTEVIISYLRNFFFPSGNFTIDVIIFLNHFCAVVLMAQLVFVVIIGTMGDLRKVIKKRKLLILPESQ